MIKAEDLQSLQSGHRARLRKKFLDGQLTDYEILELLLTYAIPRRDVRILSRQLYKKYGSIPAVLMAPMESLVEIEGIKENTVTFFRLMRKLMELEYKAKLDEVPIFSEHDKLINYCRVLMAEKTLEEFHVFYLDGKYRLIKDELHSTGTVDWAAVYIREIVKNALNFNSHHVVLLHNHPTVGTSFSTADIEITEDLENALQKVGIKLYDHLLVSGGIVYSARNLYLLGKNLK